MKKYLFLVVLLASVMFYSQDLGRVGMNTTQPVVSLDIKEKPLGILPAGTPQGVSFPNFTTDERSTFRDVKVGTMIFNTTKRCLEIFLGIVNGVSIWSCIPDANNQPNVTITPAGFTGSYIAGIPMTSLNTTKFTLCNNSFTPISNVDFSGAITVSNGQSNMNVATGQNSSVNLASGACTTLSYTLTGTPVGGTLTAKFNKLNLTAEQSTQVGYGSATIPDKTQYVISLTHMATTVQGKINNGANKLTIPIPYTNGNGSYDAVSMTQPTVAGQGGDTNNLTLNIPAGNFGINGTLNADITVDGDGEYLVKQLTPVDEYTIATFAVNMHGTQYNVIVKGTSGIPDKMFGVQTNGTLEHQFIYLPVQGPDGKTWLNNNLGADYTNINSPNFSFTGQQANAKTDYKAYGSLFQWQRKPDGHELINWTSSTSGAGKYGTTSTQGSNWTNAGTNLFITGLNWNTNQAAGPFTLWQSNGGNNPCPSGYHVPTLTEVNALIGSMQGTNQFNTNMKMAYAGQRYFNNGIIQLMNSGASMWHSTFDSPCCYSGSSYGFSDSYPSGIVNPYRNDTANWGLSLRCIKD